MSRRRGRLSKDRCRHSGWHHCGWFPFEHPVCRWWTLCDLVGEGWAMMWPDDSTPRIIIFCLHVMVFMILPSAGLMTYILDWAHSAAMIIPSWSTATSTAVSVSRCVSWYCDVIDVLPLSVIHTDASSQTVPCTPFTVFTAYYLAIIQQCTGDNPWCITTGYHSLTVFSVHI